MVVFERLKLDCGVSSARRPENSKTSFFVFCDEVVVGPHRAGAEDVAVIEDLLSFLVVVSLPSVIVWPSQRPDFRPLLSRNHLVSLTFEAMHFFSIGAILLN